MTRATNAVGPWQMICPYQYQNFFSRLLINGRLIGGFEIWHKMGTLDLVRLNKENGADFGLSARIKEGGLVLGSSIYCAIR